jgi:hypothetical protein
MAQTVIADGTLVTDEFSVGLDDQGRVRISLTAVSQFIRLDQCGRYLRLRLHERATGMRFMCDDGVVSLVTKLTTIKATAARAWTRRSSRTGLPNPGVMLSGMHAACGPVPDRTCGSSPEFSPYQGS